MRITSISMGAAASLAASLVFAALAFAADPPRGPAQHGAPSYGALPHGGMPPRGFQRAPPDFRGPLPRGGLPAGAPRYELGRPGHDLGLFNGHRFSRFDRTDQERWRSGAWRHERHDGHLGWWWVIGDLWLFYPAPIYPYPTYIGSDYWYDYYGEYPAPPYYWYYCEDPPGYYPQVQHCNVDWEPVPPQAP